MISFCCLSIQQNSALTTSLPCCSSTTSVPLPNQTNSLFATMTQAQPTSTPTTTPPSTPTALLMNSIPTALPASAPTTLPSSAPTAFPTSALTATTPYCTCCFNRAAQTRLTLTVIGAVSSGLPYNKYLFYAFPICVLSSSFSFQQDNAMTSLFWVATQTTSSHGHRDQS